MVGKAASKSRPPVATNVSDPFTDNCIAQAFCEIRSAWPRSSMMSAADSMPTDSPHQFLADACGLQFARHPSADGWCWRDE